MLQKPVDLEHLYSILVLLISKFFDNVPIKKFASLRIMLRIVYRQKKFCFQLQQSVSVYIRFNSSTSVLKLIQCNCLKTIHSLLNTSE